MVWCEDTILLLRALWTDGHSTAEIGRRLGVTKNAIVGKAHRLDLAARPSPIRRDAPSAPGERQVIPLRFDEPTLPPLASAIAQPASSHLQAIRLAAPAATPLLAPPFSAPKAVSAPMRTVTLPAPTQYRRPAPSCCWPIGEPGKRDFHFCDGPSIAGKPYCEDHAKLAYVRVRDRKEDAA
jgi:GcrA cell cycle regulator